MIIIRNYIASLIQLLCKSMRYCDRNDVDNLRRASDLETPSAGRCCLIDSLSMTCRNFLNYSWSVVKKWDEYYDFRSDFCNYSNIFEISQIATETLHLDATTEPSCWSRRRGCVLQHFLCRWHVQIFSKLIISVSMSPRPSSFFEIMKNMLCTLGFVPWVCKVIEWSNRNHCGYF